MNEDYEIIDNISADTIEVGDQLIIEGDLVEVRDKWETEDPDEVMVTVYSYESGDIDDLSLFADDTFDVWSL